MKYFLSSIALLFLLHGAMAQQDYASRFFLGKQYLEEGNKNLAMEILLPIANNDPDNEFKEQAGYLYSVASIQDSLFFQARQMLLQITTRYSNWNRIDEAQYLLLICYFHSEQPSLALEIAEKITEEKIKLESNNVKHFYLNSYDDMALLQQLYNQFPNDEIVAFRYAQLLEKNARSEDEIVLLESLVDVFGFNEELLNRNTSDKKVFKDAYNISVFLPFKYPTVKSKIQYEKNKFAYEYYFGLLQAVDTLKTLGINLNVRAFDTRGDTFVLKALLNQRVVTESDLIIGPLYPELSEIMLEYGKKNKIIVVNPFAQNESYLEENPYAFLFQTTLQHISRLQAQFALDSLLEDTAAHNIIVMDKTSIDTIMAAIIFNYLRISDRSVDTILVFDRIKPEQFLDIFGDSSHIEDFSNMFITSSNRVIIGRIISAVESGNSNVNILGQSRWLEYDNIDLSQLERRHVYFPFPEFVNFENPYYHKWRKSYTYDHLPDFYSETGFELMMQFGMALDKYGKYFQEGLKKQGYTKGFLFSGIDYSYGNFNAMAPIMRVREGKVVPISYSPKVNILSKELESVIPTKESETLLKEDSE